MHKRFLQLASVSLLYTGSKFATPLVFASARSASSKHTIVSEFNTADYEQIISANPVTVFGVTYCPYCKNTEQTLKKEGRSAYVV